MLGTEVSKRLSGNSQSPATELLKGASAPFLHSECCFLSLVEGSLISFYELALLFMLLSSSTTGIIPTITITSADSALCSSNSSEAN